MVPLRRPGGGEARGNPVRVRDCPAAVSGNDRRHKHWVATWEATASRSTGGCTPASPKTCHRCAHHRCALSGVRVGRARGGRAVPTARARVRFGKVSSWPRSVARAREERAVTPPVTPAPTAVPPTADVRVVRRDGTVSAFDATTISPTPTAANTLHVTDADGERRPLDW